LVDVIPSYLYQEYYDDDDLQGWVQSQNEMQQNYVDTFNALSLSIYTGPPNSLVKGALLDWVGKGVYGVPRPNLSIGHPLVIGPLNTEGCNMPCISMNDLNLFFRTKELVLPLNGYSQPEIADIINTSDDVYRRVISWHFFKGDGKYFSMRWLKRRIWRFCYGWNGVSPDYAWDPRSGLPHQAPIDQLEHGTFADEDDKFIADTEQISCTTDFNRNVGIRFVLGNRTVTGGEILNEFGCNGFGPSIGATTHDNRIMPLNDLESTYRSLHPIPFMDIFQEAVNTGVLELPFQFKYTVTIG